MNINALFSAKVMGIALFACSCSALAAEPPYIYKQFGYSPSPSGEFGELSKAEQKVLDSCIDLARKNEREATKNHDQRAAIYGKSAPQWDYFGIYLTGCLADEKDGRGWFVYEKTTDEWRRVIKSRYAVRTFMGLDPTQ